MLKQDLIAVLMARRSQPAISVRFIAISLTLKSRCV
ncbi:UNVERIFIED_CONTAM: hypothetical protein GTU68_043869 [Idotea baltica]|nr:hypothetical protein [Idotea baltica]